MNPITTPALDRTRTAPRLRPPQIVNAPAASGQPSRARAARRAVVWGIAGIVFAHVALAAAVEAVPQLRDPEYGYRVARARAQQQAHPDRPLILVLGTSRTQNAIDPHAMGFPNQPGSPLVFNGGLSGASPLHLRLALRRYRADGVRPAAVLVELFPATLAVSDPADVVCAPSATRLTTGDMEQLNPHLTAPAAFWFRWAAARLNPWHRQRLIIVSHAAPEWLPWQQRVAFMWRAMDEFGFSPMVKLEDEEYERRFALMRASYAPALGNLRLSDVADRAVRDLIADCRAASIPVAFYIAPESPAFRSWYSPASHAALSAYTQSLTEQYGCPVFVAPNEYAETDFADGHHMLPEGAAKFSRWLADTHLKPWLDATDQELLEPVPRSEGSR